MTDNLVDSDGNARFEPGKGENAPTVEALLLGYGSKFTDPNAPAVQTNGTSKVLYYYAARFNWNRFR